MPNLRVELDHEGIAEVLKSAEVRAQINGFADQIAARVERDGSVRRHGMPVLSGSYTTDRAAAAVTIAHPGGLGVQARHGTLTRAAGEVGLEVREWRS